MSDFDIFPTLDAPEVAAPRTSVATAQRADIAIEDVDLQKIALAHFDAPRAALTTATAKLTGVVHDLSTPGKLADAKSLRHRLINIPLAEARKVSASLKSKLTAVSKAVGAELISIEAGFEAAERQITPQIEARDAEVAAEKAEREAKEAARTAVHRENIAKLAGYATQAQGKTSAQILTIINGVSGIDIIPEQWEEFAVGAEVQKAETLGALQVLFDRTKTAEDEAAAREAQRIENERVAAELAEQARVMAAKQAELDAKLAAIAAAEKAEADRVWQAAMSARLEAQRAREDEDALVTSFMANARRIESDSVPYIEKASRTYESMAPDWENDPRPRVREAMLAGRAYLAERLHAAQQRDAIARQAAEAQEAAAAALQSASDATPADVLADAYAPDELSDDALAARPEIADMVPAVDAPAAAHTMTTVSPGLVHPAPGPVTFAEPPAQAADEEPTLTLGAINARFGAGFSMTAAFVTDTLGVAPTGTKKAAVLFRPSQLVAICDALVALAGTVCEATAA